MFYKGLVFATAAVLAALPALTAANAGPAFNGLALQRNDVSITKIDYYYPGYNYDYDYDRREAPYDGRGLADVPAGLIGGALGIVTGAIDGALRGSDYYARPYPYYGPAYGPGYGPGEYGGPYYGTYEESPATACGPNFSCFDPGRGSYAPDSGEEYLYPYPER